MESVATLDASFGRLQGAPGQDLNHGHSHLVPVAYSVMPMNSGKDYKARKVDIAQPLMASGPVGGDQGGDQGGDYIVQPVAFNLYPSGPDNATHAAEAEISYALTAKGEAAKGEAAKGEAAKGEATKNGNGLQIAQSMAFSLRGREGGSLPEVEGDDLCPSLRAADGGSTRPFIADGVELAVRRITIREAERLQGFEDGYTLIEWPTANRKDQDLEEQVSYLIGHGYDPDQAAILAQTPDGPQYRGLGNSKAVPLVRKIGVAFDRELKRFLAERAA